MKWKDVILGVLISLFVTVAGGIAIYHFTKAPELSKKEQLIYFLSKGGVFKGGVSELALSSINLENSGGVAASNVIVSLAFEGAVVRDISLDSEAGAKESGRELKEKYVKLKFDKLLPSESITINLLLSSPETPTVSIRSDASIAQKRNSFSSRKSDVIDFLSLSIPFSGILLLITLIVLLKVMRGSGSELIVSKNNTGFLLMHAGLVDQAYKVFNSAIESGRYDALTFSNLALCCALKGEMDMVEKYSSAASYRNLIWRGKAVSLFNESLILISQEKIDEGLEKLKTAIDSSPKTIKKYCKFSVHFDSVKDDERFRKLVRNA